MNWRVSFAAFTLGFVLLSARLGQAQGDALNFYKNYFVTGDYQVGGVGLSSTGVDGIATGTINISDVPAEAEILAAFLYWQVVSTESAGPDSGIVGATFNGFPLSTPDGPLAKVLDPGGTSPCWSSGGGTGNGGSKRTYTYRADVLRFFDVDPVTGRHIVDGYAVQAPDSGSGNGTPNALGASLVVIYRDFQAPLNSIVIYDGGYTIDNSTPEMSQTIAGFYDPADAAGKMTHIVGSGQANKEERLLVDGNVIIINPFQGSQGPDWDNFTFATSAASGPSLITSVDDVGVGSSDCLTWGAIIYRTEVRDSDEDGLLDSWETQQLLDPNGQPLPNLAAMGANPMRKDLFVEVGYMETTGEVTYGGEPEPAHTHLPTAAALKMVGEAFENAPVLNPDGTYGIDLHFDVGNKYQTPPLDPEAADPSPYIIPEGLARGGEVMNELETVCVRGPDDPPWVCQFSDYPGTVGWKSGFRYFKDALLDDTVPEDDCDVPGNDGPGESCERRFDRNRKDMFRYALFAHALGVPKEACMGADGFPDEVCQDSDPNYHMPQTFTGVADFPGGDVMVTLGGFQDLEGRPVGTDFWQASTLMHEWGHNMGRRHGGDLLEPNCKTNYLSVMNYLFQLRGLIDEDGVPHLDYSRQTLPGFDENGLSDPGDLGLVSYRTAWYAPLVPGTIGDILSIPAATRHCDGSPLLETDVPMVRLDATGIGEPIDWNGNGDFFDTAFFQDINFDGATTPISASSNDWDNIRLNQVGSRRNVGGWFYVEDPATGELVAFMGPLSLDTGRGDLGRGDLGRGDLGRGDLGRGDLGRGDLGRGDLGRGDLGRGDLGRGDLGRGDLGRGDLGRGDLGRGDLGVGADDGLFELDKDLARELANSPANELRASVVGLDGGCDGLSPADCHRIRLDWKASHIGSVSRYFVRRFEGSSIPPVSVDTVGEVSFVSGQVDYSFIDTEELPNGEFTYFVVAEFNDFTLSNPSIFVTITAVNDAPVAVDDTYSTDEGVPLVVEASGVLDGDTDVDSPTPTAEVVDEPANGTLTLNADGSFTYTPNAGFSGADSFTYTANDVDPSRSSNDATVSITVNPILYDFEPVKNLPPPSKKKHSAGSVIPLEWRLTRNGAAVDSSTADPKITISGPGFVEEFSPEDPGSSSFRLPTESNGWTWHFNWQTVGPNGEELVTGTYTVAIELRKNGQVFTVQGQITFQ